MKKVILSFVATYAMVYGQQMPAVPEPPIAPPVDLTQPAAPAVPAVPAGPTIITDPGMPADPLAVQPEPPTVPTEPVSGAPGAAGEPAVIPPNPVEPGIPAEPMPVEPATPVGPEPVLNAPPTEPAIVEAVPAVPPAPLNPEVVPPTLPVDPSAQTTATPPAPPATGTQTTQTQAPPADPVPPTAGTPPATTTNTNTNPPPATTTNPPPAPPAQTGPYVNTFCPATPSMSLCPSLVGPQSIATDMGTGFLRCHDAQCCSCQAITCGTPQVPCSDLTFDGVNAAVGVKAINVLGGFTQWGYGAKIDCHGAYSCKGATVRGSLVREMECQGEQGCAGATIVINDPAPDFQLNCDGLGGCANANIEINFGTAPPAGQTCNPAMATTLRMGQMQFGGVQAAAGATIAINNKGCNQIVFERLECQRADSCPGTKFAITGNVMFEQCEIYGVMQLPPQCLSGAGNNQQMFGYNPWAQQQPQQPFGQMPYNQYGYPPVGQGTPSQIVPVNPPAASTPPMTQTPPSGTQPPPAQTANTPPAGTVTPPAAGTPPPAGTQIPPSQTTPAQPTAPQGQTPPATTTPATPQQPVLAGNNLEMQCGVGWAACSNKKIVVTNPAHNWFLDCQEQGSCAFLDLTIRFSAYSMMGAQSLSQQIDQLVFEQGSTWNTVIRVESMHPIEINGMQCNDAGSCNGVTLDLTNANVDMTNFEIQCRNRGCMGCKVVKGMMNLPCSSLSAQNQGQQQQQQPFPGYPGTGYPFGMPQQQQMPAQPLAPQHQQQQPPATQYNAYPQQFNPYYYGQI